MFVRVKTTPNSPRKSVQIVESMRKGSSVTQKIVRYVGIALDDEELGQLRILAEAIKEKMEQQARPSLFAPDELDRMKKHSVQQRTLESLNADEQNFTVKLKAMKEEARVIDGIHEAYGALYDQMDFSKLFTMRKKRSGEIFREMVLARLASAKSKLATVEMLQRDYGVRLNVEAVYRMLDQVDDDLIEKLKKTAYTQTKKLFGDNLDVIFFDATTLYYESFMEDEFRKNGFSKDLKFNQPQILLALMVTQDGLPVGYELFSGETYEGHTLIPCLTKLREKYQITRVIFVADSGLFNEENLVALEAANFEYIVGARLKSQTKAITANILATEQYQQLGESLRIKEFEHKHGRLIVSHSASRAKKDAFDREKAINILIKRLRKNGTINAKELLSNTGHKKFLKVEGDGVLVLDQDKIKTEAQWDGLHGIITNSKNTNHFELLEQYKQLWQVEDAFRLQKHDLKIRPIFHFKERRIKAHVAILFAAFSLAKYMQHRVKLQHRSMSVDKIKEALLSVQSSIYYYPPKGFRYCVPGRLYFDAQKIYQILGISQNRTVKIIAQEKV